MEEDSLQIIEQEIALLVRLTTAHSPRLGDLDRSEYLILSALDKNGMLAITILAEELKLNLSTASRQVASLEKKDYIRRFPDPQNGRISRLEVTETGLKILRKVQHARYNAYAEVLQEWGQAELDELKKNLRRLNRDFKNWKR
ncbi:DNA-binding transcriptional regulator, MarR family [Fictibacillus solisalsi]|uniref:DNA-binding transcriptional regulator, MarR family n=1 Tax=Fictibacillus solisalsi TaxID=459525 RepID=A0A1H0B214_9BACL|nr:MarR family transcriptional regulator [Fictibacillus solisalsi]SDN39635.1 DNA-binding transcriptional regulator, MarR family [Fictibacillus solisalsi]